MLADSQFLAPEASAFNLSIFCPFGKSFLGAFFKATLGIYIYIYRRTRLDGYLTKKLGIFALRYVHIVDYSTTFEVF